jgi:hypothetical protein
MAVAPARILNEIEKYARQARMEAMPLASPSPAPSISLAENKLKEEDANGDSLFDF